MSRKLTGPELVRLAFLNAEDVHLHDERPPLKNGPKDHGSQKSRKSQVATQVSALSDLEKDAFEERAAIIEFDQQQSREIAEYLALKIVLEEKCENWTNRGKLVVEG